MTGTVYTCLHTNQSRSYLNHLVYKRETPLRLTLVLRLLTYYIATILTMTYTSKHICLNILQRLFRLRQQLFKNYSRNLLNCGSKFHIIASVIFCHNCLIISTIELSLTALA